MELRLELEWELDVDLGAGMGAAVELWVVLGVDLGAGVVGGAETREIAFGLLQNAILAQNGVSGPWRPASPIENATLEALFKNRKSDIRSRRQAIQSPHFLRV